MYVATWKFLPWFQDIKYLDTSSDKKIYDTDLPHLEVIGLVDVGDGEGVGRSGVPHFDWLPLFLM